ncbi:MAG: carboxypeptidase-like regulatory domain-containing protein, partial [Terriglobales bacterium]
MSQFLLALVASAGLLCLAPASASAQNTNSGTIIGQVLDAQGAAIQGAVVVLTNTANNAAQPTVTNNAGRYTFVNLEPGTYTVDIKKDGFKEAILKNQAVSVGKQLTLNVPMQVGAATQTVEVTSTGA